MRSVTRLAAAAPLLLLATTGAAALAGLPNCTLSPTLGCYSDTGARAAGYLIVQADKTMTVESCALACQVDGFPIVAATANPTDGYCYCDLRLNPAAQKAPASSCNMPCPGNKGETCGGNEFSSVFQLTCDGPLPPAPVGPPLAFGRACSQPESKLWPFCNTSLGIEDRVADLVARYALTDIGPALTSRESPAIPRLGLPGFYWGTNAIHGNFDGLIGVIGLWPGAPRLHLFGQVPPSRDQPSAPPTLPTTSALCSAGIAGSDCRPSGACPTSWPDGIAMAASWNETAWRLMGAITGRELRALDNLVWSNQARGREGRTASGGVPQPRCTSA